ncbi:radical SAM protein [Carboxylicivirga sp. RSCT41]|uniref:radical SAM protein n=1 Tax=Carboxylicivirga agarovorans TaxID=3417570 RepID=UPI003D337D42
MECQARMAEEYKGFEVGPIRPPSEADSLLIRVTRNCPWNKCRFCALYKGKKFSLRPKEHIIEDLNMLHQYITVLQGAQEQSDNEEQAALKSLKTNMGTKGEWAYYQALNWMQNGMKSIFLQDANSLIIKPNDMIAILQHIRRLFPQVERITSYSRSHTIARIADADLEQMAKAGLNRIHIGMESASDEILKLVKKGADKSAHILAGQKVKRAGMELSEYYMPGLGGMEYSEQNALETADALNQINPDFIRIRTLALPDQTELAEDYRNGTFTRTNDAVMARELLIMIKHLYGINSVVKSDHILNLLEEVEGQLPGDKNKMIKVLQWYLDLSRDEQVLFSVGRRTGIMNATKDLENPVRRQRVQQTMAQHHITNENADRMIDELMKRFI